MNTIYITKIVQLLIYYLIYSGNTDCCKYSSTPDDDLYRHMAKVYASNHRLMKEGKNCPPDDFKEGVTNGAFWYNVKGNKPVI